MLIIDGSFTPNSTFVRAALQLGGPLSQLTFWEQITGLTVDRESSELCIDGHVIADEESIAIFSPPRFAKVGCLTEEQEFGWSEWSAAMNAVLYRRSKRVLNGHVLIFAPHLACNPYAFRRSFSEALSLKQWTDGDPVGKVWLLVGRGFFLSYPERAGLVTTPDAQTELFNALVTWNLDLVVLEIAVDAGTMGLARVHLTPPSYAPFDVQLAVARLAKGFP